MDGFPASYSDEEPVVSVAGLTKVYAGKTDQVTAVDNVSFDIAPGKVVGLLGPNGAGKTTTVKTILGLITPTEGDVVIHGTPVSNDKSHVYNYVSAVLEGARNIYWHLTPRENIQFFESLQGFDSTEREDRHDEILDILNLSAKSDEPVENLSRGMKQKVALGCTLARETPVLFLDEPTLGLDVHTSHELQDELRRLAEEEGRTCLITSHNMDVVESICDRIIVLNDGEIVIDDSIENLLDAFEAQSYQIELKIESPEELREELAENYQLHNFKAGPSSAMIEITLRGTKEFYECIKILEGNGAIINSLTETKGDLEDIFVNLIDEKQDTSRVGER